MYILNQENNSFKTPVTWENGLSFLSEMTSWVGALCFIMLGMLIRVWKFWAPNIAVDWLKWSFIQQIYYVGNLWSTYGHFKKNYTTEALPLGIISENFQAHNFFASERTLKSRKTLHWNFSHLLNINFCYWITFQQSF